MQRILAINHNDFAYQSESHCSLGDKKVALYLCQDVSLSHSNFAAQSPDESNSASKIILLATTQYPEHFF